MRPAAEVHDALACLLSYPGEGHGARYPAAVAMVSAAVPEASAELRAFLAGIAPLGEGELEELYTRTFDNVAERSLEVGWQLFGENYARGVLLVRLRALLRQHGVPERIELPDHLAHVLPLLARADEAVAASLAHGHARQACEKVLAALRELESPWSGVLAAVLALLALHEEPVRTLEASA
jgi:nitrate reductase delta subunit